MKEIIARNWADYELIALGPQAKVERFGKFLIRRPENHFIDQPSDVVMAVDVDAEFVEGRWLFKDNMMTTWQISLPKELFKLKIHLQLGSFKNPGIFPEQIANWDFLSQLDLMGKRVLNLFAYSGVSSCLLAQMGAEVTHVDASTSSMNLAKQNAKLNAIDNIRWIREDCPLFVRRALKRGQIFDGIIMDPPPFGRGPKGETWKLSKDLPGLIDQSKQLLNPAKNPNAKFFILNAYQNKLPVSKLQDWIKDTFGDGHQIMKLVQKCDSSTLDTGYLCRICF